jgi:hypothetical protein
VSATMPSTNLDGGAVVLTTPRAWRTAVRKRAPRRLTPFLLLLGERARRDGTVHNTTREWLAEQFDVDTRTIQRWLKDCYGQGPGQGWLTVLQRGQKHIAAQVYGLTIPTAQGDIRSCSQGDTFYLPETTFSGRHVMSPIYRTSTSVSEFGAVKEDAADERTTAASAAVPQPRACSTAATTRKCRRTALTRPPTRRTRCVLGGRRDHARDLKRRRDERTAA